jgi:hypothetical protein
MVVRQNNFPTVLIPNLPNMKLKHFTLTFLTFFLATILTPKAAEAATFSSLASGLDNPRGTAFGPDGSLYITETGRGGDGKDGRCIPSPSSQFIPLCAGDTGSLIRITPDGKQETILPNLPSLALTPSGEQGAGPADIKFDNKGNAYLLMGYAGNPDTRETVLKTPSLGQLFKLDLNTKSLTSLADFADYEIKNNPDGTDIITNPYAMDIIGNTAYVVDGGGNSIYSVGLDGSGIKSAAAFPTRPIDRSELQFPSIPPSAEAQQQLVASTGQTDTPPGPPPGNGTTDPSATQAFPITFQSVPTAIATAPDGTLTVGEYTYFPYPENKARIFSVDPNNLSNIKVIADGFTQLTGVTYDKEGNLYALQHMDQSEWKGIQQGGVITGDISGSLIKIAKDGTRSTIWSGKGLEAGSGITLDPKDGSLVISNRARLADTGAVIRIDPSSGTKIPEPTSVISLIVAGALGATSLNKRKRKDATKVKTAV